MGRKGSTRLDPLRFMEMTILLPYRLVEAVPLGQLRSPCDLTMSEEQCGEVVNLALLAFMATLLPEYVRAPERSSHPLLCGRLKSAVKNLHVTSTLEQNSDLSLFLLWALFIGVVSVIKGKELQELSALILETSTRLKLCRFPWIRALHDQPGFALWELSRQRNSGASPWLPDHSRMSIRVPRP